jgi:cell division protein FtsW
MPQQAKTDKTLFGTTVGLVFFGLVMVYSASSVMAMQDPRYHSSTYFVVRHAVYLVPALLLMMFMKRTRYLKLQTPAVAFAAIGSVIILLFLVYLLDPHQHRRAWVDPQRSQRSSQTRHRIVSGLFRGASSARDQ